MASRPRTLYEKIWDAHVVERRADGTSLLYRVNRPAARPAGTE